MSDWKRRRKVLLIHIILLPPALFAFYFFTLGPKPYAGVDEAVVEKVAREHGREARTPFVDPGEGDLLLFAFLVAGAAGGFAAGYYWRTLTAGRKERGDR